MWKNLFEELCPTPQQRESNFCPITYIKKILILFLLMNLCRTFSILLMLPISKAHFILLVLVCCIAAVFYPLGC